MRIHGRAPLVAQKARRRLRTDAQRCRLAVRVIEPATLAQPGREGFRLRRTLAAAQGADGCRNVRFPRALNLSLPARTTLSHIGLPAQHPH